MVHKEAAKYRHKRLSYYELLESLFSGVGASGRFARTGEIQSMVERESRVLELEGGESVSLEQNVEEVDGQIEQDIEDIGSSVSNNSGPIGVAIQRPGVNAGSQRQSLGSLVRSRSGLSDGGSGETGDIGDGGHHNKCICTSKTLQGALTNALLALRDEVVEQRIQSQIGKEEEVINKLLELYAESDVYTESEIIKLVVALQESKNAFGF